MARHHVHFEDEVLYQRIEELQKEVERLRNQNNKLQKEADSLRKRNKVPTRQLKQLQPSEPGPNENGELSVSLCGLIVPFTNQAYSYIDKIVASRVTYVRLPTEPNIVSTAEMLSGEA